MSYVRDMLSKRYGSNYDTGQKKVKEVKKTSAPKKSTMFDGFSGAVELDDSHNVVPVVQETKPLVTVDDSNIAETFTISNNKSKPKTPAKVESTTVNQDALPSVLLADTNVESNTGNTVNEGDVYNTDDLGSTIPQTTDDMQEAGVQYQWNQEAKAKSFLDVAMKKQEARRTALEQKSRIQTDRMRNAGESAAIVANQNQNKMGITGDAAKDFDRAASVMRNAQRANLYSQKELIDSGLDMANKTADLYGSLKEREYSAQEYQKALEQSDRMASITGVYYSPEQMQLLGQMNVSQATLDSPYASVQEKARAQEILDVVNDGFLELGISKQGIKTIEAIYQEAQIAHNERMENIASWSANQAANNMQTTATIGVWNVMDQMIKDGGTVTQSFLNTWAAKGIIITAADVKAAYGVDAYGG